MSNTTVPERMVTPDLIRVIGTTFTYFLAVGALMPVLPRFVEGPLGGGDAAVGIVVGAFALTALLIRPWAGRWGDRRGRRVLIVSGAMVAAISMAGLVFVDTVVAATLLRLLTGVGEALFFVGATAAVVDLSPEGRQGEGMSYFSLGIWAAIAVGPILGEVLLSDTRFDLVWVATAGLSIFAAVLGLTMPETSSGQSGNDGPLFDRNSIRPGLILLASVWGLAGFTAFVPLHALEIGMAGSASVFLLYGMIMVTIRSLGAKIPDKLGPKRATTTALAASAAGLVGTALFPTTVGLFLGVATFAVGQALAFPAIMLMAVRRAPADRRGAAVGTVSAALDVAFGFGGLSLGLVADSYGYPAVFAASALVALAGLVLLHMRSTSGLSPQADPVPGEAPST
jgi:predicted MFS family arabinose efflux permease